MIVPRPGGAHSNTVKVANERQQTYERLKPDIDRDYPEGHLVAIDESGVIADASDFDGIVSAIAEQNRDPRDLLVVRAGTDDLDPVIILFHRPAE